MSLDPPRALWTKTNTITPICVCVQAIKRLVSKADPLQGWEWEFLSCLVSLLAVSAVLAMAVFLNGRPLPDWPMGLTPNTVVSLLGELSKATLILSVAEAIGQLKWLWFRTGERTLKDFEVYDLASRGPSGSVKLLLRPRLWGFVSLGALLTLLAIGLGPSLQQTLFYAPRIITVDTAIVERADAYYGLEAFDNRFDGGVMLENKMKGAIYGGLFKVANIPLPMTAPSCPTGNCTWDRYTSLGVCHTCHNISSALQLNGSRYDNADRSVAWVAPNGFHFSARRTIMKTSTVHSSLKYPDFPNPILVLSSAFYPSGSFESAGPPAAHECVLFFCVRVYNSSSLNGVFSEQTIETWPDPRIQIWATDYLYGSPVFPVNPTEWPSNYRNWSENSTNTIRRPGDSITYRVDTRTLSYLRDSLGWLMSAEHQAINDVPQKDFTEAGRAIYRAMTESQSGLPDMMEKFASSMTNTIRNSKGAYDGGMSPQAIGRATKLETQVHIRWMWLLACFSVVLIGLFFLLLTVIVTSKARLSAWKTSALAVMAIKLDEGLRSNLTATGETLHDFERCAREALVQLSEAGDTDSPEDPSGDNA